MITHTPGPWLYIDATKSPSYQYRPLYVIKAGEKLITSFSFNDNSPWFPTKDEAQANARLIAAAPELYEFIQQVAIGNSEYDALQTAARNLIAKV